MDDATLAALERVRATRRKLVLVTGRELADLREVFPRLDLFDRVVAENGAVLYRPADRVERSLAEAPPEAFVAALRQRASRRSRSGRAIVATWEPHETAVLDAIRDLGLELQVIFNKGAVMVLPSGVNKATGLDAALRGARALARTTPSASATPRTTTPSWPRCECSVAVANALPPLKERADLVTGGDRGAGVTELIDQLVEPTWRSSSPADAAPDPARHRGEGAR